MTGKFILIYLLTYLIEKIYDFMVRQNNLLLLSFINFLFNRYFDITVLHTNYINWTHHSINISLITGMFTLIYQLITLFTFYIVHNVIYI